MRYILFVVHLFFITFTYGQKAEGVVSVAENTISSAQHYKNERIKHFHSDIQVDKDGTVNVTEHIKVYSLGQDIKRGIFRVLPLTRNLNNKANKVRYKISSVKKNGVEEPFRKETDGATLKIYVGDEDTSLKSGVYDYEIRYSTSNHIGFFEGYDEFYWNVNGNDWGFSADSVSAIVALPQGVHIRQNSCYTGEFGDTEHNCQAQILDSTHITWSSIGLAAGEGLTVAVGFDKGIFLPPPPPGFLELYGVTTLLVLAFAGILYYSYSLWNRYGRDPEKPTVYPQFNVPETLSPASLGYLKEEGYESNFVTAALVHLAVNGYIKIEESQESAFFGLSKTRVFHLYKLKEPASELPREEYLLLLQLFSSSESVRIDGDYSSKIANAVSAFHMSLDEKHKPLLKQGTNLKQLTVPSLMIAGTYIVGLIISYIFTVDFGKVFLGFFLLGLIAVFTAIAVYLVNRQTGPLRLGCVGVFAFFIGLIFVACFIAPIIFLSFSSTLDPNFKYCYIFILISALFLILFAYLIKRPSEDKIRIQSLIDGFKMYMGAAENELLQFHNPPQFTPDLFEKYLPYAIVLGVDKIWGKRFENLMEQMSTEYTNTWYSGGTVLPYSFGSSLNSSLTKSMSSATTPPSSSSSSGSGSSSSSGSSGGGFSGGGGGGGGGGGW